MSKQCHRNLEDHCCWLGGGVACPHLEEATQEGFKWTCGLYRKFGDWKKVHNSKEYKKDVQPFWNKHGKRLDIYNCGDFTCVNCIDANA